MTNIEFECICNTDLRPFAIYEGFPFSSVQTLKSIAFKLEKLVLVESKQLANASESHLSVRKLLFIA